MPSDVRFDPLPLRHVTGLLAWFCAELDRNVALDRVRNGGRTCAEHIWCSRLRLVDHDRRRDVGTV